MRCDHAFDVLCRRLEHLQKLYDRGEVPRIAWLDPLTFDHIQQLKVQVCPPSPTLNSHEGHVCHVCSCQTFPACQAEAAALWLSCRQALP